MRNSSLLDGIKMCIAVGRLRLILNAEGYEYTDLASHGTGLRIVFHSHDERPAQPEIVRGVMLSAGTHAHINFRTAAVSRLQLQFYRELSLYPRSLNIRHRFNPFVCKNMNVHY